MWETEIFSECSLRILSAGIKKTEIWHPLTVS
jgi:hypothetical protein